eukprot:6777051-Prymnesium_polylepis.1
MAHGRVAVGAGLGRTLQWAPRGVTVERVTWRLVSVCFASQKVPAGRATRRKPTWRRSVQKC